MNKLHVPNHLAGPPEIALGEFEGDVGVRVWHVANGKLALILEGAVEPLGFSPGAGTC